MWNWNFLIDLTILEEWTREEPLGIEVWRIEQTKEAPIEERWIVISRELVRQPVEYLRTAVDHLKYHSISFNTQAYPQNSELLFIELELTRKHAKIKENSRISSFTFNSKWLAC